MKEISRVFTRQWRSENSPATTQNSLAKICLFAERALPFHNNPSVTLHCILLLLQFLVIQNPESALQ